MAGSSLHFIYPGTCTAANAQATYDALSGARRSGAPETEDGTSSLKRRTSAVVATAASSDDDEGGEGGAGAPAGGEGAVGCTWVLSSSLVPSAAALLPALGRSPADLASWSGIKVSVSHPHELRQVGGVWGARERGPKRMGTPCSTLIYHAA